MNTIQDITLAIDAAALATGGAAIVIGLRVIRQDRARRKRETHWTSHVFPPVAIEPGQKIAISVGNLPLETKIEPVHHYDEEGRLVLDHVVVEPTGAGTGQLVVETWAADPPEDVCSECEGFGFVQVYSPRPPAFDECPVCHNPEGHPWP